MKMATPILQIFEEKDLVKMCAPMVRYSKIQFRTLARDYGCDICYTPMIMADSFCRSENARRNEFTTNNRDTPLVVQFAAKTVPDFVGAAYMVLPYSNGVELNCGCPQRWAIQDGYGCALLSQPELISDLIRQCRSYVPNSYTISAKIRLLCDIRKTVQLCRDLEKAGVSYITVHGRTQYQKNDAINTEALRLIKDAINIPLVANGDIRSVTDARVMQELTGCDGVMAARGMLSNPAMFQDTDITPIHCVQKWVNICFNNVHTPIVNLPHNYSTENDMRSPLLVNLNENQFEVESSQLSFPIRHPNLTFQCFHHHLVFMVEKILTKKQRQIFNNLQTFESVVAFLKASLSVCPQMFHGDAFVVNRVIHPNFDGRDSLYLSLLQDLHTTDSEYRSGSTEGTFITDFKSQVLDEDSDDEILINDMFYSE